MFLGVAETIVSSLLCCGVGIVQCLFNLLYYVIGVRNTKKPPVSCTLRLKARVRSYAQLPHATFSRVSEKKKHSISALYALGARFPHENKR